MSDTDTNTNTTPREMPKLFLFDNECNLTQYDNKKDLIAAVNEKIASEECTLEDLTVIKGKIKPMAEKAVTKTRLMVG